MILARLARGAAALLGLVGAYLAFVTFMLSRPWPPDGETLHLALPIFGGLALLALAGAALLWRAGRRRAA